MPDPISRDHYAGWRCPHLSNLHILCTGREGGREGGKGREGGREGREGGREGGEGGGEGRGNEGDNLKVVLEGLGDIGSSLTASSCPGVVGVIAVGMAAVGRVWGVTTSERRGDLILAFSPSIPSLEGVCTRPLRS